MSSIVANKDRVGNFTSSEIHRLCTFDRSGKKEGAPFHTYVEEKQREKRLGRSISTNASSRDTAWGNFIEIRVFELLGFEYKIKSDETFRHPTIEGWTGSPDLIVPNEKVSDIKCYAPNNFSKYADVLLTKDIELLKKENAKEYWQLVSNAIINQVPKAEAILYAPYISEQQEIIEMVENYDGADQYKYRFIAESEWYELPFIPDNSYYKNLIKFEFEVPKEDIEFLTERVQLAIKLRDQK